jgi:hypothetical protein
VLRTFWHTEFTCHYFVIENKKVKIGLVGDELQEFWESKKKWGPWKITLRWILLDGLRVFFFRSGLGDLLFIVLYYIHKNAGFNHPSSTEVKQPECDADLSPPSLRIPNFRLPRVFASWCLGTGTGISVVPGTEKT